MASFHVSVELVFRVRSWGSLALGYHSSHGGLFGCHDATVLRMKRSCWAAASPRFFASICREYNQCKRTAQPQGRNVEVYAACKILREMQSAMEDPDICSRRDYGRISRLRYPARPPTQLCYDSLVYSELSFELGPQGLWGTSACPIS